MSKFETCVYKNGPNECYENSCCGNEKIYECFYCLHPDLNLFGLTINRKICEKCSFYTTEEELKEQEGFN